MPFIDSAGGLLRTVELGQVPLYAPTFQLRERIGYYEAGISPEVVTWAEAHVPDLQPEPGNRTDLASVPVIFWSLIASYGRQTAPAIVHDSECWRIRQLDVPEVEALAERERVDRLFRLGLRELGVAPFRAWLMWTFVSFERYQKHSIARLIGMLALGILGIALVVVGTVLALTGTPAAAALIALPLATSAVTGRHWALLVWASYAGALMLPVAVLQLAAYLPYFAIENLVWAIIDLPKHKGSPVVGPTDVKNIQRVAS
ncbi:DUF1353 domain-containing protein [Salinibacterium sp. G-O1]|uniref:DUF1353 domain-containing protein n=1 Tax=Salinibacterium sp. G-O1 TaxID=3046208 RepID=UPI0024B9FEA7|nr:DUF1353 domain-containing protein [Salinibacterium sp. G-O1]MDJ0335467.1 DUF1353 domain-containing protein [Salinibacterium sp. G-O1]